MFQYYSISSFYPKIASFFVSSLLSFAPPHQYPGFINLSVVPRTNCGTTPNQPNHSPSSAGRAIHAHRCLSAPAPSPILRTEPDPSQDTSPIFTASTRPASRGRCSPSRPPPGAASATASRRGRTGRSISSAEARRPVRCSRGLSTLMQRGTRSND